ncbi:MAG: PQQ-binding-like beta-propeller repeat protein [Candidatus Dormibacteria bacterium]
MLAAVLALSTGSAVASPVHAATTSSTEGQCLQLPNDGSRCPTWGHTWLNPGGNNSACAANNVPQNQVADATGVYVTGWACDSHDKLEPSGAWLAGNDVFTVAYNLDGSVRWVARYNGPGGAQDAIGDEGWGIAVSPSGDRVYVTGGQNGGLGGTPTDFRFVSDFVTIAYDTTTGAQLWSAGYHGPAVGTDIAEQVAVSGDGQRVYVTGESQAADLAGGASGGSDATTIAYVAATGAQDWVSRYHAPASNRNNAVGTTSISVHGTTIATSGTYQTSRGSGYEVLAIEDNRAAHTGTQLWSALSDPTLFFHPARGSLAATANGVFLTGTEPSSVAPPSSCPPQQTSGAGNAAYGTISLDPTTGALRWSATYTGQTGGDNGALGLASDAAGDRVYVAGQASGPAPQCTLAIGTVAYDGSTGAQLWSDYQPPLTGTAPQGFAVTAAPDGSRVYVAGLEYHLETLGYRGDSRVLAFDPAGTLLWSGRYNSGPLGPVTDLDSFAYFLSLSPDGSRLYLSNQVNRHDQVNGNTQLYGTVAYDTSTQPSAGIPEAPRAPALVLLGAALALFGTARVRRRATR